MPITKSAKKAIRQSKKRRDHNIQRKTAMKRLIKQVRDLVAQNKQEEARALVPAVYQALDKGAKSGVVKKNNASRRKSRIMNLLKTPPKKN